MWTFDSHVGIPQLNGGFIPSTLFLTHIFFHLIYTLYIRGCWNAIVSAPNLPISPLLCWVLGLWTPHFCSVSCLDRYAKLIQNMRGQLKNPMKRFFSASLEVWAQDFHHQPMKERSKVSQTYQKLGHVPQLHLSIPISICKKLCTKLRESEN